jgi:hypothetical protein
MKPVFVGAIERTLQRNVNRRNGGISAIHPVEVKKAIWSH